MVIDPPAKHVSVLYNSETYPHLPALSGLARQPHLRPDGSLVLASGFDAATGLYGAFDPQAYAVPTAPTPAQARAALQTLTALLSEFDFATPHDQAAALAGMLTASIRVSLPSAPLLHIKAA